MGDAAEMQRKRGRKQKTDRQDAQHILGLSEERLSADLGAAKWRSSSSACRSVLKNCLTPPTLSETRFNANNSLRFAQHLQHLYVH
jgi:hypothetical protein